MNARLRMKVLLDELWMLADSQKKVITVFVKAERRSERAKALREVIEFLGELDADETWSPSYYHTIDMMRLKIEELMEADDG